MHAVDAVVCAHDGPRLGFLDDVFECREVDFAQRTLGDVGADAQTVGLLIVGREVLERGAHALGLHAGDDAHGLMAGKIRVFGPVFEATAAKRVALDVDAGAENDRHFLLDAFLAHGLAHLVDELGIPGAGQAGRRREAGGRHGIVQIGFAGAGRQGFAQSVRAIGDHVAGDAFGFDALQMPGVAAGRQGGFLFKGQVVDGGIGIAAHGTSFMRFVVFGSRLVGEPTTNRLVGTLSKQLAQHANHL